MTFTLKRFGVYWSTQNSFFSKSLTMCPILVCHLRNVWRLRMNILQLSLLDHCCRTYTGHSIRPKFCCCLPRSEEYCSRHTNQWPIFCTWLLHSCWPIRTKLLRVNQECYVKTWNKIDKIVRHLPSFFSKALAPSWIPCKRLPFTWAFFNTSFKRLYMSPCSPTSTASSTSDIANKSVLTTKD